MTTTHISDGEGGTVCGADGPTEQDRNNANALRDMLRQVSEDAQSRATELAQFIESLDGIIAAGEIDVRALAEPHYLNHIRRHIDEIANVHAGSSAGNHIDRVRTALLQMAAGVEVKGF